ncbi:hypothetical protein ZIOFF_050803 [Zingiber officinale]|uniref:Strictosidine synthase conserved region domain-containing protein n=1 Tax=Zingiber officinale TaxID=94328 RepID=A0A8J5KQM1_ZINOF|nr:hypothetical protein ZIOFF_050803 [Zingiber officinale]
MIARSGCPSQKPEKDVQVRGPGRECEQVCWSRCSDQGAGNITSGVRIYRTGLFKTSCVDQDLHIKEYKSEYVGLDRAIGICGIDLLAELETCKGSKDPKREHVCGRPLGLHFGKQGELYVADAYHGLLVVTAGDKFATPVVTETQGRSLRFTNSLDVDERTGVVYFTDSSKRFQRREFMSAVISGDKTGRLMSFNLVTKEVRVVLDGLSFPNGVALSKDGTFLILAETTTCRVLRYWIQPPADSSSARNGGDIEVVAELPGFPDNIRRSPRGGFWVALHSRRSRFVAWALSVAWIQRLILEFGTQRLGVDLQRVSKMVGRWNGAASAVRVSGEGEVLEVLEGVGDRRMRFISQVEERNGTLWLGSVIMPFAGVYPLAA